MYKLTNPSFGQTESNVVIRLSDNAFIPLVSDNIDYQQYLKWVALGNTPLPADEGAI
jgi:hypothetical protein